MDIHRLKHRLQMNTIATFLFSLTLAALFSCHQNGIVSEIHEDINIEEKAARLLEADNSFGLELFQQVRNKSNEENLLLSPLSVSVALAMAYNGANADTKKEMEKTLNLNGLTVEQVNASYQKVLSELQSLDEKVTFEIANALFYAHEFNVRPDFLAVNKNVYDAEISPLNFASPSAVETINKWVDEKTHGKISTIIDRLNPLDRLVLLNAIYFYGTWSMQFDEHGTQLKQFTKSDGTKLQIPTMSKLDKVPYLALEEFKAIKLPYGEGSYNMVVILPEEGNNSGNVIKNLSSESWKNLMAGFKLTDRVQIAMPRFKFSFESTLNQLLSDMGMQKAFIAREADFSGISEEDLFISAVKHKTFIDVNETGTEAAAVTGAVFATTSFREEPPVVPFIVDKPFVFAITEKDSGAILFIGEVNHPKYD